MKSALRLRTVKTSGQSNVDTLSNTKTIMNLDTQAGKVVGYGIHKNGYFLVVPEVFCSSPCAQPKHLWSPPPTHYTTNVTSRV